MAEISYSFIGVQIPDFSEEKISLWLEKVLENYKVNQAVLSYVFVSDEFLLEMNQKELNHDYYTDIITFNFNEENSLSGEMFISIDRVKENAVEFSGGDFESELCRVMAHGVLHLLGFNDKESHDAVKMRQEENVCLTLL